MSTSEPDPAQPPPAYPGSPTPPGYVAPPVYPVAPGYAQPGYAVPPAPAKRPARVWDIVVTIILLVGLGILTALMSFFGFFLAMASDPCGAIECNSDLIATGMLTAVILPWLFLVIAVVLAVVLLVRRRLAFWVPLAASPLVIASWFVGAAVASAGVPSG